MPDQWLLLQGIAVAAGLAAAVFVALARWPRTGSGAGGTALGIGSGFLLGCLWIGIRPHWPPREDLDRLLLLLLPLVVAVEVITAIPKLPRWVTWLLRALIAMGAAPLLLFNTIYVADLAGPGSREWSRPQATIILGGLALGLTAVWTILLLLARRSAAATLPLALALVSAGSALAVMLSGYGTGGQMGLPLAAALAGAGIAALVLRRPVEVSAAVSLGVVGLFALLVIGRFFGTLETTHALVLFATPLLCGLPELLRSPKVRPWMRSVLQMLLVSVPVVFVIVQAQQKFTEASRPPAGPTEPSLQDYMDFGK